MTLLNLSLNRLAEIEITTFSFFLKLPLLGEIFLDRDGVVYSSWKEVRACAERKRTQIA